jgi:hypothetical protein
MTASRQMPAQVVGRFAIVTRIPSDRGSDVPGRRPAFRLDVSCETSRRHSIIYENSPSQKRPKTGPRTRPMISPKRNHVRALPKEVTRAGPISPLNEIGWPLVSMFFVDSDIATFDGNPFAKRS